MVNIRRLPGPKNPAEMTYYVQLDGVPISGTSAAKTLNTVDSQTMALTLGYFVQLQAERTQLPFHTLTYYTHTYVFNTGPFTEGSFLQSHILAYVIICVWRKCNY